MTPETVALATRPAISNPYVAAKDAGDASDWTPIPAICDPIPSTAGFSVTSRLSAVISKERALEPDFDAS